MRREKIREIFDEIINDQLEVEMEFNYLKNAAKNLTVEEFSLSLNWLLTWLKESTFPKDSILYSDLMNYELNDIRVNYYKKLFEHCPELKEVFVLDTNSITWNSSMTKDEIIEIRDYVHVHYKMDIRVRLRKKK